MSVKDPDPGFNFGFDETAQLFYGRYKLNLDDVSLTLGLKHDKQDYTTYFGFDDAGITAEMVSLPAGQEKIEIFAYYDHDPQEWSGRRITLDAEYLVVVPLCHTGPQSQTRKGVPKHALQIDLCGRAVKR